MFPWTLLVYHTSHLTNLCMFLIPITTNKRQEKLTSTLPCTPGCLHTCSRASSQWY